MAIMMQGPPHLEALVGESQVAGAPVSYGVNDFSLTGGGKRKRKRTNRKSRSTKRKMRRSKGKRTKQCKCKICKCNPCLCGKSASMKGQEQEHGRKNLKRFRASLKKI